MSEKWLIAVTAGRWQAKTIAEAKSLGLNVIAIDSDPAAAGFTHSDINIVAGLNDVNKVVTLITRHLAAASVSEAQICGVLSICSDAGMLLAGKLREHYGIITGPDATVSNRLVNKKQQRLAWKNDGIEELNWHIVNSVESALLARQRLSVPFIIKPVDSAGSRGVFKVDCKETTIDDFIQQSLAFSPTNEVIMESFMDGKEYTVEGFVYCGQCDVLAITEKDKIPSADNLVAYKLQTAQLPEPIERKIETLVKASVASLGYQNGPVHAEVILMDDNEVGMVELAGRGGGFMVFEAFVQAQSSFDIVTNTVKQAVGLPIENVEKTKEHTILRFFPNEPGKVTQIYGFDKADAIEGVQAGAFVNIGEQLALPKSDGDRMGYYLCHAETVEAANELAQLAETHIRIEVTEIQE